MKPCFATASLVHDLQHAKRNIQTIVYSDVSDQPAQSAQADLK